jgi:hypothetical protein
MKRNKKSARKTRKQKKEFKEDLPKEQNTLSKMIANLRGDTESAKNGINIKFVKDHFDKINIQLHHLLIDPILAVIFAPIKCCLKKSYGFIQRPKILERCQNKYSNELEIISLISRVRECHSMTSGLQSKQQKELLKYTKDRVINL